MVCRSQAYFFSGTHGVLWILQVGRPRGREHDLLCGLEKSPQGSFFFVGNSFLRSDIESVSFGKLTFHSTRRFIFSRGVPTDPLSYMNSLFGSILPWRGNRRYLRRLSAGTNYFPVDTAYRLTSLTILVISVKSWCLVSTSQFYPVESTLSVRESFVPLLVLYVSQELVDDSP